MPVVLKDCSAFTTQTATNAYLKATPAAKAKLDSNGNGVACESKFAPKASAKPGTTGGTGSRSGSTGSGTPFNAEATCGGYDPNYRDPRCGPYPDQAPDVPGHQAPGYYQRPQTRQTPGTRASKVPPGYYAFGDTGAICPRG